MKALLNATAASLAVLTMVASADAQSTLRVPGGTVATSTNGYVDASALLISGGTYESTYQNTLNLSSSSTLPSVALTLSGNGALVAETTALYGTNDLVFQLQPQDAVNGYAVFEGFGGKGLVLSSSNTAGTENIIFAPQRTEKMRLTPSGYLGIGTTNPTYPLSVNGTIEAKEVLVQTGWSDYVFDKDYRLAPLKEVEGSILRDKHLPGIPSAKEVAEGGIRLGDMESKLLAKIEELTLHEIDQEKRLAIQAKQIELLEAEVAARDR